MQWDSEAAVELLKDDKYNECIQLCTKRLNEDPRDETAWLLKVKSLIELARVHTEEWDIGNEEVDESDFMLQEPSKVVTGLRPGTSLRTGANNDQSFSNSQSMRPVTKSGRPLTGTTRLSSSMARKATASQAKRIGTSSIISSTGVFIDSEGFDPVKFAKKGEIGKALCDYLLICEGNGRRALALATEANKFTNFKDAWWLGRAGKCFFMLKMYAEAEEYFLKSNSIKPEYETFCYLARISLRNDQPLSAVELMKTCAETFPYDPYAKVTIGQIYERVGESSKALEFYKKALVIDPSCKDALASLATHHFYGEQPEIALTFFKRIMQHWGDSSELWNNIALAAFYSGQIDIAFYAFENALEQADDSQKAEIYYNLSHSAIYLADYELATQSLKLCIAYEPTHAEAINNLGVLFAKGLTDEKNTNETNERMAHDMFKESAIAGKHIFECLHNAASLHTIQGNMHAALQNLTAALKVYPKSSESSHLLLYVRKQVALI